MRRVTLPADDGFLREFATQWWYWTGHLATAEGRRFGFEVCFFAFHADVLLGARIGSHLGKEGLLDRLTNYAGFQMAHTALSDLEGHRYSHACEFAAGHPATLPGAFQLATRFPHSDAVTAAGGNGRDTLHVGFPSWGLDLSLVSDDAARPPLLQYDGLLHKYTFGGYTYYYSRPRMQATGTVMVNGQTLPVSGAVWFDRQYGELNQIVASGWQWFALQFDDGREVVVFDITGQPGERYGAMRRSGGQVIYQPGAVAVEVLDHWTSPVTGIAYPAKWQVTFGGETVVVSPLLADQEMIEPWPWPTYWEGDAVITSQGGRPIGQAYVELSGFKRH